MEASETLRDKPDTSSQNAAWSKTKLDVEAAEWENGSTTVEGPGTRAGTTLQLLTSDANNVEQ